MKNTDTSARQQGVLACVFGGKGLEVFILNFRRIFLPTPIDRKELFRDMARRTSGNVRFRAGQIMFPDERRAFMDRARKLPPAHKMIEDHFDLKTGTARK